MPAHKRSCLRQTEWHGPTEFSLREKRCCPAGKLHFAHPERRTGFYASSTASGPPSPTGEGFAAGASPRPTMVPQIGQAAMRAKNGKRADFRGNYASKSAIMHKIAETAKNRILRCFCRRQFCGKTGGKNRKNRLAGASIHHANKSPPHKHEKSHPCTRIAQKCHFRLIFGHFPADLCTQKHPFSPTANYRNSLLGILRGADALIQ